MTHYRRIGDLLHIAFYFYHNGGLSSYTNNGAAYGVSGLPFSIVALQSYSYQFIKAGYHAINGTNYYEDHRWQANSSSALTLYGPRMATQHSGGTLEYSATGVLKLA